MVAFGPLMGRLVKRSSLWPEVVSQICKQVFVHLPETEKNIK